MGISRKALVAAVWATSLAVVAGGGVAWSNVQQAAAGSDAVNVCVRDSTQAMRLETTAKPCKLTAATYARETRVSLAPADAVNALGTRLDAAESTNAQQDTKISQLEDRATWLESSIGDIRLRVTNNGPQGTSVSYSGRGLTPGSLVTGRYLFNNGSEQGFTSVVVAADGTVVGNYVFTAASCANSITSLYYYGSNRQGRPVTSDTIAKVC